MTTGREEESAFETVHQSREFEVFLRILAPLASPWSRVAAFLQASPGPLGAVTIRHSKSSIHLKSSSLGKLSYYNPQTSLLSSPRRGLALPRPAKAPRLARLRQSDAALRRDSAWKD